MATKTITTKVDDIDGTPAAASFTFTWQGYKYHIDLSDAHAAEMKADFDKWTAAARRDRGGARQPRAGRPAAQEPEAPAEVAKPAAKKAAKKTGPSAADIRAWATENGIAIATRGRIAPAVLEQYIAAHTA